jgi:hypothetical protein
MQEKHYDLDALYNQYMNSIAQWLPEGVIEVDLDLLSKYHLLHFHEKKSNDTSLTRYFHIVEAEDKLILVNSEFVIWIVPERNGEEDPRTLTLIALNKNGEIKPETAFSTQGVYNDSSLVLRLLEQFLLEIHSTEDLIARLDVR